MSDIYSTLCPEYKMEEIQASIHSAIQEMIAMTPEDADTLRDKEDTILVLAFSDDTKDPQDYLDFIGKGVHKICFDLSDKWVVKFTRSNPELRREHASAMAAYQRGLGRMFQGTQYIICPGVKISAYSAIPRTNRRERLTPFDVIIFQRKVDYLLADMEDLFEVRKVNPEVYWGKLGADSPEYAMNGKRVRYAQHTARSTWQSDIKRLYGREFFDKWEQFQEDWDIMDLHLANIGYIHAPGKRLGEDPYGDLPVVIDWLSGENAPKEDSMFTSGWGASQRWTD